MNIILLGAPGSGKGTQSDLLSKKFHLYYFQTGGLARELSKKDKRIKKLVDSGKLIPEQEMTMYVIDFLSKKRENLSGILFEGFPRFISQYRALIQFLKTKGDDVDAVISIDISEKEAVKRISSRRICSNCGEVYNLITNPPEKKNICNKCGRNLIRRSDDNPESIKVRFKDYIENTKKLTDYLDRENVLIRVDGERPIKAIYEDIYSKLKKVEGAH